MLSTSEARPRLIPLVVSIVKNEGIFTFWQGLSPALYRHFGNLVNLVEAIVFTNSVVLFLLSS